MSNNPSGRSPVIYTNKARCRDCYRCVRVCPVKAIRVDHGQASVVPERCIGCGTCVRECPQGAKAVRDDVDVARELLASGRKVAVSLAPSFAAAFESWERPRLPAALRRLGFAHIGETAIGAEEVAQATAELLKTNDTPGLLCTACPAFVRYVEGYAPDKIDRLLPIVSPMLAHAKHLRTTLGDCAVVFIGPCTAKKDEAERSSGPFRVDCALTFVELRAWLGSEGIDLAECEESAFDETACSTARMFPLEGGGLRTAGFTAGLLDRDALVVSGAEEIRALLEDGRKTEIRIIEPLFCRHGCIGGPALGREHDRDCREAVLDHAESQGSNGEPRGQVDLRTRFKPAPVPHRTVTEEEIRDVLAQTGKLHPEDELNCGACGYDSCRAKAIAVLNGLAEPEMCIPSMRLRAERRTDRIIETTPNGILILDDRLTILGTNPAFKRLFCCSDAVLGQHVSRLLDPAPFEQALLNPSTVVDGTMRDDRYKLVVRHLIYVLPDEHQVVGIFVNLTEGARSQEALQHLQSETVLQAQELLDHQIRMAQVLTRLLGESTAQGELLVQKLLDLAGTTDARPARREFRPWNTDTST